MSELEKISKGYLKYLEERSTWLGYLEDEGVANWPGYAEAQERRDEDEVDKL